MSNKTVIENEIRVVCYLPAKVNRKLQAYASLKNESKMQLMADIVIDYMEGVDITATQNNSTKKEK